MNNDTNAITCCIVPEDSRMDTVSKLFGMHFPMRLEPSVFNMAGRLAAEYNGGYWDFFTLSNGGFYMAPRGDSFFSVSCDNGYEGAMTADALGITVCLYAYSHLSFRSDGLAQTCAEHYHLLREYALEHEEASNIFSAID